MTGMFGDKPLVDEVDMDSHAYVFAVFYKGNLVSTVRLHHVTPDHRVSTTFSLFPDKLNAWLDDGKSFIDPVRFAADPETVKSVPALPFVTLRPAVMACHALRTDLVIQLATPNHAPFYRRVFKAKLVAEPIVGAGYNRLVSQLAPCLFVRHLKVVDVSDCLECR